MAGTIKLVTNPPDTSGTYGSVGPELNSIAHGDIGGVAEGFVNARLSDRAALPLVGWYRRDGGYIHHIHGRRTFPTSGITPEQPAMVKKAYNPVHNHCAPPPP